jgi:hypothetical protein
MFFYLRILFISIEDKCLFFITEGFPHKHIFNDFEHFFVLFGHHTEHLAMG